MPGTAGHQVPDDRSQRLKQPKNVLGALVRQEDVNLRQHSMYLNGHKGRMPGGYLVVNWEAVQAVATAALVVTSAGAISYAGLQLRHERDYRAVENLEKQLSFFLSEKFV